MHMLTRGGLKELQGEQLRAHNAVPTARRLERIGGSDVAEGLLQDFPQD